MKKGIFFSLLIIYLGAIGCGKIVVKDVPQKVSYKVLKNTRKIDVSLDASGIDKGVKVVDILITRAQDNGVLKALEGWLNKSLLFSMKRVREYKQGSEIRLNRVYNRNFTPHYDKLTDMYDASFNLYVELDPTEDTLGEVTGIQGGFSLATSHIAIELLGVKPVGETYFVVVRENEFNVGSFYQLIGVGKIYNVIGRMAQGEIMTSTQEIKKGDMVFLLKTHISPVSNKIADNVLKKQRIPITKVVPVLEKIQTGPKEMK